MLWPEAAKQEWQSFARCRSAEEWESFHWLRECGRLSWPDGERLGHLEDSESDEQSSAGKVVAGVVASAVKWVQLGSFEGRIRAEFEREASVVTVVVAAAAELE